MLTKLQIAFCVVAGLGITVFGVGMIAAEKQQAQPPNASAAHVPGWLAPVAWGSFGAIAVSCLGVIVTLALDREKEPGSDDEESELLPVDEPAPDGEEIPSDLTTIEGTGTETTVMDSTEGAPMEFVEPGNEETVEFSTLPTDE